ncbi:MAG: hypothetical protein Q8L64_04120 [bacterium]|nr:hypothetical protein [bacterium]
MTPKDPIQRIEKIIKDTHDKAGVYTEPVLKRYPLLFAFLVIFSVAAILHGFELWSNQIQLFTEHPITLIGIGVILLVLTGQLYKSLDRM